MMFAMRRKIRTALLVTMAPVSAEADLQVYPTMSNGLRSGSVLQVQNSG